MSQAHPSKKAIAVPFLAKLYRSRMRYWRRRLEARQYEMIQSRLHFVLARQVRNGYATNAPAMCVEFRGVCPYVKGRNACYAIRLGSILHIKRWGVFCPK